MLRKKHLASAIVTIFIAGCSGLSNKTEIAPGHARIISYTDHTDVTDFQTVYPMCHRYRIADWIQSRQLEAGIQNIWLLAEINDVTFVDGKKEAIVNFQLPLEDGKSYIITQNVYENHIYVWLQDAYTREVVSEMFKVKLKRPFPTVKRYKLMKSLCKSGSV